MFFPPENHGQVVTIAVPTVFVFLATLAVVGRLSTVHWSKNPFHADDWVTLFSLVCLYGLYISLLLNSLIGGAGTTDVPATSGLLRVFLQTTAARFELWCTSVAAIQLAIVLFYLRLFSIWTWFRRACYGTIVLVAGWWVAIFISELLACVPYNKLWDPTVTGTCFDDSSFCTAGGLIHVVFDFWILALPLPVVWRIQTSRISRAYLTMLFAAGAFASICSILRISCLISFEKSGGSKLADYLPGTFETLEPAVGLICISVPSLVPAARRISRTRLGSSIRHLFSRTKSRESTVVGVEETSKHDGSDSLT